MSKKDEKINMTEEELRCWVREQVEKDEQLVQRRAQLAQVEDWVNRKERGVKNTQLLYDNACESVLEYESMIKGLYTVLGLDYRDTDSEEEGEAKFTENVIHITDDLDNGDDDCGADGTDDYVVMDTWAAVPEMAVKDEFSEDIKSTVKAVDAPAKVSPPSPSTTSKNRPSDHPLPTLKTLESPVPVTAPSPPGDLPALLTTHKKESSASVSPGTSTNETVETLPLNAILNTSTNAPVTLESTSDTSACPQTSTSTVKSMFKFSANQKPAVTNNSSEAVMTPDTPCKTKSKEKVKWATPISSSKPSSTNTPSKPTVKSPPAIKAKKQADNPEIKSPTSIPRSGATDTPASDKAFKKTSPTKPPNAAEVSQTSQVTPVTPLKLAHVQKTVELKINMSVFGRRRTKTWHQGTILSIKKTESGPRYKVLFDGGKGKSVLSAHHLACVEPPMLKDLFVGCRVVACYKEENQSWLHAAVVAEMPDRKNRMRFLVFFDDGRPAYMALPDLHLVCKTMSNMTEDIEDLVWRTDMVEYLNTYPNPIFVVMRVGQDSRVVRDGKLEQCTVSQVDGSLIQVCYKKDQEKEWVYKGSSRLEQIQKIKTRLAEQKKEQTIPKAPQNTLQTTITSSNLQPAPAPPPTPPLQASTTKTTITLSTTTSTASTATCSTAVTPETERLKTSTAPSVSQTVSSGTASLSMIMTFAGKQPVVFLNRVTVSKMTVKATEKTEPTLTTGVKRPFCEDEQREQNVLRPVEPRLKYVPHRCCPACLNNVRPTQTEQHRGQNPLLIPLLHGFRRMTARRRLYGKMSFHVFYRAPCGRSMCEMEEVQAFLFETRCDFLFLDMFCLDPFVLVKTAMLPSSMTNRPQVFLPDITGGNELVPVRCVNELNSIPPPSLTYTRHRLPGPGVFINTNLDFMVGCDCTDGCLDRSKCACYQMTIEATSLFTGGPVDVTAGYTHKRLAKYVPTGVYECNPLCRCDPRLCGNRLVQHGLQLRLEIFMTQHKGWGLRCLDDVSKGTFVCVFTGRVIKDEGMHSDSTMTGNDYLANLDYIEGVEKLKEGYESEAYCSDREEESDRKTLVTMTTGASKKHGVFQVDRRSSSEEENEETTHKPEPEPSPRKRERKADDEYSEEEDDVDDEDYKISSTDCTREEWKYLSDDGHQKNYSTRRNTRISEILQAQTEVNSSMAKMMRKAGPGGSKPGFAKKSTNAFAIKSSHSRVKPKAGLEISDKKTTEEKKTAQGRRCTRSLFDGENSCYLIDAKHEGNLARYINHSCRPNLFVQNVFVDTHDLRFPWVAFFSSKRIRAGTELTWDYSYEVGSVEGKILLCCCGSSDCTGRLL